MTETAKVLRQAAELVGRGWCQQASATDVQGFPVMVTDPRAVRWCADGAILATGASGHAWSVLMRVLGSRYTVTEWNDAPERTQQEVIAALLRAAEIADQETRDE